MRTSGIVQRLCQPPPARTELRPQRIGLPFGDRQGEIEAKVSGSELYTVRIAVKTLPAKKWSDVKRRCTGKIGSLIELLRGDLSEQVMEVVADRKDGLFPLPGEISLKCSCPDWADMCKHVAAVLYGVGAQLDTRPELLFKLRGVDHEELIAADAEAAVEAATRKRDLEAAGLERPCGRVRNRVGRTRRHNRRDARCGRGQSGSAEIGGRCVGKRAKAATTPKRQTAAAAERRREKNKWRSCHELTLLFDERLHWIAGRYAGRLPPAAGRAGRVCAGGRPAIAWRRASTTGACRQPRCPAAEQRRPPILARRVARAGDRRRNHTGARCSSIARWLKLGNSPASLAALFATGLGFSRC